MKPVSDYDRNLVGVVSLNDIDETRVSRRSYGFTIQVIPPGIPHNVCHRSDYRKSLPGDLIRIGLKIEQICRLFWDIFSSAIMNDLFMIFASRLRWMPRVFVGSEIGSQWRPILGHPPADSLHGYLYFEPGAWISPKGFRSYWHIVKN